MELNKYIDHTLLKPEAKSKDIDKLIDEAKKYNFKAICINSSWVKYAKEKLKDSDIKIASVIDFPFGAAITQAKVQEAKLALSHGASEIDMVMNIGKFKDGDYEYVLNDIKSVKKVMGSNILKVIIETALLNEKEIIKACQIVLNSGAEFVKTSTGYSYRGASESDIEIMKKTVGDKVLIKASGGIKNQESLKKMIELGSSRIGTSSSVALMENQEIKKGY